MSYFLSHWIDIKKTFTVNDCDRFRTYLAFGDLDHFQGHSQFFKPEDVLSLIFHRHISERSLRAD